MENIRCGMIMSTTKPTGEMAAWLHANCRGQWDLHPAGTSGDGKTRKFMVLFETERDRVNFEGRFAQPMAA